MEIIRRKFVPFLENNWAIIYFLLSTIIIIILVYLVFALINNIITRHDPSGTLQGIVALFVAFAALTAIQFSNQQTKIFGEQLKKAEIQNDLLKLQIDDARAKDALKSQLRFLISVRGERILEFVNISLEPIIVSRLNMTVYNIDNDTREEIVDPFRIIEANSVQKVEFYTQNQLNKIEEALSNVAVEERAEKYSQYNIGIFFDFYYVGESDVLYSTQRSISFRGDDHSQKVQLHAQEKIVYSRKIPNVENANPNFKAIEG